MLSETGEGKVLKNGFEEPQAVAWRFCHSRWKGSALRRLAGALHTQGVGVSCRFTGK